VKNKIPITFATMAIGTIAIAGVPPLAGFSRRMKFSGRLFSSRMVMWCFGLSVRLWPV